METLYKNVQMAALKAVSYLRCVCTHCLTGCHELMPQRKAPRRVDGFVSTCLMKDIWSIKAYSFTVPFY